MTAKPGSEKPVAGTLDLGSTASDNTGAVFLRAKFQRLFSTTGSAGVQKAVNQDWTVIRLRDDSPQVHVQEVLEPGDNSIRSPCHPGLEAQCR